MNSPSSGPIAAGGPPSSPESTCPSFCTCSSLAPSSTITPTRQLPSVMSGGASPTITKLDPETSVPSISPRSISKASANLQKSRVARCAMFDHAHGQIASQEQFS